MNMFNWVLLWYDKVILMTIMKYQENCKNVLYYSSKVWTVVLSLSDGHQCCQFQQIAASLL